jgi:hypothetical protein
MNMADIGINSKVIKKRKNIANLAESVRFEQAPKLQQAFACSSALWKDCAFCGIPERNRWLIV